MSKDDRLYKTIASILAETSKLGFDMGSEAEVGPFLRTLVASKPDGKILELGTGTGLSTAWMLAGLSPGASLTSVDNDKIVQHVARTHLGDDKGVTFICIGGAEFISGATPAGYDLIFADAWPGKFSKLDETLALLKPGGLYVVDDLLPQSNWPQGHQTTVDVFIADMKQREGFHVSFLNWASGLLVAVMLA